MSFNLLGKLGFLASLAILMSGCLFDSGTEWRDGKFNVSWIDISDEKFLYYDLGNGSGPSLVKQPVVAVGSNQTHIVIKSRNTANSILYHYILKSDEWKIAKGMGIKKGPYNQNEFIELTDELGLPPFEKLFD